MLLFFLITFSRVPSQTLKDTDPIAYLPLPTLTMLLLKAS